MTVDSVPPDERDHDPPTNERGEFVCARRCPDETRCRRTVPLPYFSCYQHERSDPIARTCHGGVDARASRKEQ